MKKTLELLTTKAIEYGSNSKGSWIKYSNGIIEQFMTIETFKGYTLAYGSVYMLGNRQVAELPVPVVSTLYANASAVFGGCAFVGSVEHTTTYVACRPLNATKTEDNAYRTEIRFHSVGRWK